MTTIKSQVATAAALVGDDAHCMVCFYRPADTDRVTLATRCMFDALPEREFDDGLGSREGEPFIGFTDRYVYVCGAYDGSEWIQAVPRSPDVVEATGMLPVIGG